MSTDTSQLDGSRNASASAYTTCTSAHDPPVLDL